MIVLLALQSAMDYLRNEEIIEGSIKINYQTVQQKVLAVIPTKKIAAEIVKFASERIQDTITTNDELKYRSCYEQRMKETPRFKIVNHVVVKGETLEQLSQRYGINWRVIQRVNHMNEGDKLMVGQRLRIPSKIHQLI